MSVLWMAEINEVEVSLRKAMSRLMKRELELKLASKLGLQNGPTMVSRDDMITEILSGLSDDKKRTMLASYYRLRS